MVFCRYKKHTTDILQNKIEHLEAELEQILLERQFIAHPATHDSGVYCDIQQTNNNEEEQTGSTLEQTTLVMCLGVYT